MVSCGFSTSSFFLMYSCHFFCWNNNEPYVEQEIYSDIIYFYLFMSCNMII